MFVIVCMCVCVQEAIDTLPVKEIVGVGIRKIVQKKMLAALKFFLALSNAKGLYLSDQLLEYICGTCVRLTTVLISCWRPQVAG